MYINGSKRKQYAYTTGMVILSAIIMAFSNNTFIQSSSLLPSGFMGVATLVHMIGQSAGMNIPASLVLLIINVPVALFCAKHISKRFVLFSLLQILCYSVFQDLFPKYTIFEEPILNVIFGGVVYGLSTAVALRGNASTGGTDFIALYVSNKNGKEIWMQVFLFNVILLAIFGLTFGWEKAGYSILFQFISTRMITTFHTRYKRVTMEIFTKRQDAVVKAYIDRFTHGINVVQGRGGYTGDDTSILLTVTTSYELPEAVALVRAADPDVVINIMKSEQFYGKFNEPKL